MKEIEIEQEWKETLDQYFKTESFVKLDAFVRGEYLARKVFPKPEDIFRAFTLAPFSKVNVVILGQDPYHGEGQAMGLSFSVPRGVAVPPSLRNIYKEIESDIGVKKDFTNGNLESWGQQGVLLLNSILSVVADSPASHQDKGWEEFTDTVIKTISLKREHVVFMFWGNFAKSKSSLVDKSKHLVLEASHPSPFAARNGFFGCHHFSLCNKYLQSHNKKKINW